MARKIRSPNALIDLVAIEGPLSGQRLPLDPSSSLLLGRSNKGIHLVDPLVSIEHAEIVWENDCYFLVDMRSATGTFIDGQPIGASPVRLVPGMILGIGESQFLVEARQEVPQWALPLALGSFAVAMGCVVLMSNWTRPVSYEPVLSAPAPILNGGGSVRSLDLPLSFIRKAAADHRSLAIRRVTDFDDDGISEVWFGDETREWAITFDSDGGWRILAELPVDCRDVQGVGMPVLRCGVDVWHFDTRAGVYHRTESEGITAWVRRPPASEKDKKPTGPVLPEADPDALLPVLATLTSPHALAGFLADRGVREPIHYLVCEGAFPDVRPFVVTQSGAQVPLSVGCIRSMELSGTFPKAAIGDAVPEVLAVTSTGRDLFLSDLASSFGGNDAGMFLTVKERALVTAAGLEPARLGTVLVDLVGTRIDRTFDPIAEEGPLESRRHLLFGDQRSIAPAQVADLPGTGTFRIDVPGCHEVVVSTGPWTCASSQWCGEGGEFAEVRQVGCERSEVLFRGLYANGSWRGSSDGLDVELQVEGVPHDDGFDVLRTRVGVRLNANKDKTPVGG